MPKTSSTHIQPPTTQPAPPRVLAFGDVGADVSALQRQLQELRYWVGDTDGVFRVTTQQAVFAFQSVNRIKVDGRVGPQVRDALQHPALIEPRSESGLVWEVDKATQTVAVVRNGAVEWVWHASTGTDKPYVHDGRRLVADTPSGRFTFDWQVDRWRQGALGPLYRPKYFHRDGIALHGYGSVPPYPASHGCVRVTLPAMDFIWANQLAPLGTPIWVYG